MSNNEKRGRVCLSPEDTKALAQRLHIIPEFLNGAPYAVKVRRGEIERRRISLVKAEKPAPNQLESQELYRLCRYKASFVKGDGFATIGWALRSMVTGDYFVFSEFWFSERAS